MKYEIAKDKILIYDKTEFNPIHILECGQIFRCKKIDNDEFVVYSQNKFATIKTFADHYEIITGDTLYFENFFDLKFDYSALKTKLSNQNVTLKLATEFGSGIRILNQNPVEMIFSFIISSNNNIKRIQSLVEKLCQKCGTNMGDFYAFPTIDQIATLSVDDLKQMGMGFRAKYIFETAQALKTTNMSNWPNLKTENLILELQKLSGVGPKVADCIVLFGYHKTDSFPVDTWVEKIYNCYFSNSKETNRQKIHKNLIDMFGQDSGYAQQYLFYYKRELDKNSKQEKVWKNLKK